MKVVRREQRSRVALEQGKFREVDERSKTMSETAPILWYKMRSQAAVQEIIAPESRTRQSKVLPEAPGQP